MRRVRTPVAVWLCALGASMTVVVAGCGGGGSQAKLSPISAPSPLPADLCAVVPPESRQGLLDSSSEDPVGTPTATCALHTPDGAKPVVAESVTLIQYDDDDQARTALDSQCQRIDSSAYKAVDGLQVQGADQACGAQGVGDPASLGSINATVGSELVLARVNVNPTGQPPALQRAQTLASGVIGAVAGSSGSSTSPSPSGSPSPTPAGSPSS